MWCIELNTQIISYRSIITGKIKIRGVSPPFSIWGFILMKIYLSTWGKSYFLKKSIKTVGSRSKNCRLSPLFFKSNSFSMKIKKTRIPIWILKIKSQLPNLTSNFETHKCRSQFLNMYISRYIHDLYTHEVYRKLKDPFDTPSIHPSTRKQD